MIFKLEAREMSEKAQYRTRQITELENYLCSMEGKHVTVSDICKYFKSQGISIGTTTVYRQLDRMVEQGLVAKYVVDGTSSACFEYLGHDEHCHKQKSKKSIGSRTGCQPHHRLCIQCQRKHPGGYLRGL